MNPNTQPPQDRRGGSIHALLGVLGVRLSQQEQPSADTTGIVTGVKALQPPAANQENALPKTLGTEAVDSSVITMQGGVLGVHPETATTEPTHPGIITGPASLEASTKRPEPSILKAGQVIGGGFMPGFDPNRTAVHALPTTWPSGQPPHSPRVGELPYVGPAPAHVGPDAPVPPAF